MKTLEYLAKLVTDWRPAVFLHRSRVTQAISLLPLLGYIVIYSDWTRNLVESLLTFDIALPGPGWFSWETRVKMLYWGSTLLLFSHILHFFFAPNLIKRFRDEYEYWQMALEIQSPRIIEDIIADGFRVNPDAQNDARVAVLSKPIYKGLIDLLAALKTKLAQTSKAEINNLVLIFTDDLRINTMDLTRLNEARAKLRTYSLEVYGTIDNRETLTNLLSVHYSETARSRPRLALACNVLGYPGALLFFLPSIEVFFRALCRLLPKFVCWPLAG